MLPYVTNNFPDERSSSLFSGPKWRLRLHDDADISGASGRLNPSTNMCRFSLPSNFIPEHEIILRWTVTGPTIANFDGQITKAILGVNRLICKRLIEFEWGDLLFDLLVLCSVRDRNMSKFIA
ncbi:hypothetical protein L208DRAFT_405300 [Tricholoma matsutake]|nr:hypothetical protein L208DRAFT_669989 [Tricholoma matsutake 945]KAF8225906.1 hypothetical protein L208DRAFT_405300 [Tricholoma matsutake 945]